MPKDIGRRSPTLIPLVLLCVAILLSVIASSGPIQWMGNGMTLAEAARGQYFSQTLSPLEHPLYRLVTTSLHDLYGPRTLSLLNSLLLVPLAWMVVRLARSVGATPRQALVAALATLLSHAVFWVSTKAEVTLLHSLLVLLAYCMHTAWSARLGVSRALFLIGLVTGLAASVHQLTLVVLLPLYVQLLWQYRFKALLTAPGMLLGFAAAYPALAHDLQAGLSLVEIGRRYLTGAATGLDGTPWEGAMLRFDAMWHEKNSVCIVLLSLIGPQLAGLLLFPRTAAQRLLWSAAVLNLIFALSYNVFDRFTLFLPGIALLSILGVIELRRHLPRTRLGNTLLNMSALSGPLAILFVYTLYSNGVIQLPTHTERLPFRDDIRYYTVPYLPDRSAERFVRAYDETVPEGSLIVADWTPLGAMRAGQTVGLLADRALAMCGEAIDLRARLGNPGVYLARLSYCGMIAEDFALEGMPVGYALHTK